MFCPLYPCKFGSNLPIVNVISSTRQKKCHEDANADGIHTKTNMSASPLCGGGGGGKGGGGGGGEGPIINFENTLVFSPVMRPRGYKTFSCSTQLLIKTKSAEK